MQRQRGNIKFIILAALFGVMTGVLGYTLFGPDSARKSDVAADFATQYGTQYLQWYPQPRELVDFTLVTDDNLKMTNADLQGQWTLAFVGYTFCPDICPTTLAALNRAYPKLSAIQGEYPIRVWFLSVDPQRDTVERLASYVQFFNDEFVAATGEHKELYPLVRSMGMMYAMAGDTSEPNYLVDHSGSVVLINPQGQVVGRFKPQHAPGQIAISDTEQILADLPLVVSR
ncbi:MAG: SCO family protein [Glaciecola sp.]|jgi:protein SCO1/2